MIQSYILNDVNHLMFNILRFKHIQVTRRCCLILQFELREMNSTILSSMTGNRSLHKFPENTELEKQQIVVSGKISSLRIKKMDRNFLNLKVPETGPTTVKVDTGASE